MIVFVNQESGGGRGGARWESFKRNFRSEVNHLTAYVMNGKASTEKRILELLEQGERQFVAAGGDGTVNLLLNMLLTHASNELLPSLALGAIGIGSSNDFHKPLTDDGATERIPTQMDFGSAQPRDVGCITFNQSGRVARRYFLINASIGITADANRLFNHPGARLGVLKSVNTSGAILYAALSSILKHRDRKTTIFSPEIGELTTDLTNLGILKSPHISGWLRFHTPFRPDNGKFDVHVHHGLSRRELVSLLQALRGSESVQSKKSLSWETSLLRVRSDTPFVIEYDGETIFAASAQFHVVPRLLKVCIC